MTSTLVLLCKRPSLGIGKQRLASSIGQQSALNIAKLLLACVLEDVLAWQGDVVIAPAHRDDREWAQHYFKSLQSVSILPQIDGNLGQRLNALDQQLRAKNMQKLIYIGSDAPTLSINDLKAADAQLDQADTVLKPTVDGGVSIMASQLPWPDLSALAWSTAQLGQQLLALCQQTQTVAQLETGFDVDTYADLAKLTEVLVNDKRPARHTLYQSSLAITKQHQQVAHG